MRRAVAWTLLALWGVAVVASVAVPALSPPSGTGVAHGLNRVEAVIAWQLGAGALAPLDWVAGQGFRGGSPGRWLSRLPAGLAGLPVVGTICLLLWTRFGARPPGPTAPVAAPALPTGG